MKFNEIADMWIKKKRCSIKETSVFRYELILNNHLNPAFGGETVEKIDDERLKDYTNQLKNAYKVNTYSAILTLLKTILEFAYEDERSGLREIHKIKVKKVPTNHQILEKRECKKFNKYLILHDVNKSLGSLLALNMGLRIGEICALKWGNVDLDEGSVFIEKSMQRVKNMDAEKNKTTLKLMEPKSISSIRKVPIPDFLCKILREKKSSLSPRKDDFVLAFGDIKIVEPRTLERWFKKDCETAIGKVVKFHELRHTFATVSIASGIDYKTISLILGHSDVGITLRTYTNMGLEEKRRAVRNFEKITWE